jgi:hypothetical protein
VISRVGVALSVNLVVFWSLNAAGGCTLTNKQDSPRRPRVLDVEIVRLQPDVRGHFCRLLFRRD